MFRGSYASAIDAYQKVWPKSAIVWNKIGLAYHHLYALDEAMKDYQMALTAPSITANISSTWLSASTNAPSSTIHIPP